jgi:hypothetical protein
MAAIGLTMTAVAAGCGGGGGGSATGDGSTSTTAPSTSVAVASSVAGTTVPPSNLVLRVTDLRLVNSEESDNGVRILLPAGVASASVTITGLPSPNQIVSVCQANDLDRRLTAAVCRMPANGEAVTLALGAAASGVEIVQAGVAGSGAAANTTALDEVSIRYAASSREVNVRLPQVAAGDSGGRPTFGLTPAAAGGSAYRATLTWTVIQVFGGTSSSAQLDLLQGGNVVSHAEGGGLDVRLNGTVPTPGSGDVAVRVQNSGIGALVNPKLNLVLP